MAVLNAHSNSWEKILTSQNAVRPAANYGTTVTPGASNAKGAYTAIFTGAQLNFDVWRLYINLNSGNFSAEARDQIIDIGVDPAGGTNYSILIPDLLGSVSNTYYGSGISYFFPIQIASGSQIAARAAVNATNARTLKVYMIAFGKPSRPDLVRPGGRKVIAYGINAAASAGTALTSGTTAEGTYVSLGTTSARHWYWQFGIGINDATMTSSILTFFDLAFGTATNKHFIMEDFSVYGTLNTEVWNYGGLPRSEWMHDLPSGQELWARAQCSSTPDTGLSAAAYGVAA